MVGMKLLKLKNKKGVALAVTMMMLTVLTVMVGAFFEAYRSHFSITRSSTSSETALAGCESVADYITFRLEHDRNWGSAPFTTEDQDKDPVGEVLTLRSEEGTYNFSGTVADSGATFNGTVYNYLTGTANDTVSANALPQTAYCNIACKYGDTIKRVRFAVRMAPLFDSSVLSRADINVDAQSLKMRSLDRNRNLLRSEEDIYVPDMLTAQRTKFFQPDSNQPDNNGMLWAKGDVYSYLPSGTPEKIDEAHEFATAANTSNGKIVPNAKSHFSVFDIDSSKIRIPESHDSVSVPQGRWTFVRRRATVDFSANYYESSDDFTTVNGTVNNIWVDVLEYYAPDATTPTKVYRAANRTDDLVPEIPSAVGGGDWDWDDDDYSLDEGSVTATNVDIAGYPDVEVLDSNELRFTPTDDPTSTANFTFDLRNQEVRASHNAVVDVAGPFEVTSETDVSAPAETPPPVLNLGYETALDLEGGVSKAVVRAAGTINIADGITEGLGALISDGGDVKIQPKNTDTVDVDSGLAGSGLLIYADGDVVLTNPNDTSSWNFAGLVYARGGIEMVGNGAESATFLGSIVSLNEDGGSPDGPNGIEFQDCGNIEFIYSSELLDAYVRQLPGDRIQVETVFWQE